MTKDDVLSWLICPYCQSAIRMQNLDEGFYGSFGIAVCACDEYPILEGIIYLQKDLHYTNKKVCYLLRNRRYLAAIWKCFYPAPKRHRLIVICAYIFFKITKIRISFANLLKLLYLLGPSRSWWKYLMNRSESPDFKFAIRTFRDILEQKQKVVVDIGSGVGHFERMICDRWQKDITYLSLDKLFINNFIALMYRTNSNIAYIAADVEAGLPFKDKVATDILLLDSFTWILEKKKLLEEIYRVLKYKGKAYFFNINPHSFFYGYGIDAAKLYSYLKKLFKKVYFFVEKSGETEKVVISVIKDNPYSCFVTK